MIKKALMYILVLTNTIGWSQNFDILYKYNIISTNYFKIDHPSENYKPGYVQYKMPLYKYKVPKDKKLTLTVYNFSGAAFSVYYDSKRKRQIDEKKPSFTYLDDLRSVYYLHTFDDEEWIYIKAEDFSTKNIQIYLDFNLTEIDEFPSYQMNKKIYFNNYKYSWNKIYFNEQKPNNYYFKFIYLPEFLGLKLVNHWAPNDPILWQFDKKLPIDSRQKVHGNDLAVQLVDNNKKVFFLKGNIFHGRFNGRVVLSKAELDIDDNGKFYYQLEPIKTLYFDENGEIK